jgi:uncharacterized protein
MLRAPHGRFLLRNERTGEPLATHIEGAFDSASRRRGLLGRLDFPDGACLIIAPCSSVHTFFMRIAIDVVFASRDGRVIKTYQAVPAWRIAFAIGAFATIELPAGTLARVQTTRDDRLTLIGV